MSCMMGQVCGRSCINECTRLTLDNMPGALGELLGNPLVAWQVNISSNMHQQKTELFLIVQTCCTCGYFLLKCSALFTCRRQGRPAAVQLTAEGERHSSRGSCAKLA